MASRRVSRSEDDSTPRRRPATTPQGRENQLISLAADLAERQLADGTASAQVITHYLKLGSSREKLEQERIRLENGFLAEKTEALKAQQRIEELYGAAMQAFKGYRGDSQDDGDDDAY